MDCQILRGFLMYNKLLFEKLKKNLENYFYSDVQVFGEYPKLILKQLEKENIQIHMADEDLDILKENTVDFVSFSYYMSR